MEKTHKITGNGVKLVSGFEGGMRLKPYQDSKGLWTVGVGHLIKAYETDLMPPNVITMERGEQLFRKDLNISMALIHSELDVEVTDNQFDAMVSYSFNIGIGNFLRGTLFRLINEPKETDDAATIKTFWRTHWITGDGASGVGLDWRRYIESELYYTADSDTAKIEHLIALANAGAPNKDKDSWQQIIEGSSLMS